MRKAFCFRGRVQGVGFRATARSVAARFAVSGFVRNQPDGTVHLEVQGEANEIDRYIASLHDSMRGLIQDVESSVVPEHPGEASFQIAHHAR